MAFYKSAEWGRLLVNLDDWWRDTTEFINSEGEQLPPARWQRDDGTWTSWDAQTTAIIDGVRALTTIDPMPFWEVARLMKTWQSARNPIRAPLADVQAAVERAWGLEMELRRLGVVESTPKQKLSANTCVVFSGEEPTPDVKDLAFKLAARGDKSERQTALEFMHGNESRAASLLAQIRALKRKGRIKFVAE